MVNTAEQPNQPQLEHKQNHFKGCHCTYFYCCQYQVLEAMISAILSEFLKPIFMIHIFYVM